MPVSSRTNIPRYTFQDLESDFELNIGDVVWYIPSVDSDEMLLEVSDARKDTRKTKSLDQLQVSSPCSKCALKKWCDEEVVIVHQPLCAHCIPITISYFKEI